MNVLVQTFAITRPERKSFHKTFFLAHQTVRVVGDFSKGSRK